MAKKPLGGLKQWSLILSWAMYDLANQFFALNVVSLYFARWLTLERAAPEIFYSISFGASIFLVAILAPLLGEASDRSQRHKPFLIFLTLLSVIFTVALGLARSVFAGLLFFAIANFGCQLAIVFYNALMVNVAPREKFGLVSGIGRMFGYSGAVIALYVTRPIVLQGGYQAAFLPTGILFLVFSLPCLIFVKDKDSRSKLELKVFFKREKLKDSLKNIRMVCLDSRRLPGVSNFLIASFFCLAAVNAVILFMSVYVSRVFGLNEVQVINLIAFATVFAVIGSFLSGILSDYFGHKRCLLGVLILWGVCFSAGAFLEDSRFYPLLGGLVGIALSSTWVILRALAIRLVPAEKTAEIFGIFNCVGYLSGILGAILWGVLLLFLSGWQLQGYRITLFSLNFLILISFIFLLRVKLLPLSSHN